MAKHCSSSCSDSKCRRQRDCACKCEALSAIDFQLSDGCIKNCNSNTPHKDNKDYMCNVVGGETLINFYGITYGCDVGLEDTVQFQATASKNKIQKYSIIAMIVAITIVFSVMVVKEF